MARTTPTQEPVSEPIPDSLELDEPTARLLNEGVPVVLSDENTRLLATKEGDMFLYTDQEGNLSAGALGMGLYYRDTRFLSHYEMRIQGLQPVLLSSSAERAYMSYVDLTNADVWRDSVLALPQQTLNVRRIRVIK